MTMRAIAAMLILAISSLAQGEETIPYSQDAWRTVELVDKDKKAAVARLNQLIDSGDATAALLLFKLHDTGRLGYPPNKEEAYKFLLVAADAGNGDAQFELARVAMTQKKDYQEGCKWLFIAEKHPNNQNLEPDQGFSNATLMRMMCSKDNAKTGYEVAKAKTEAESWKPKPLGQKSSSSRGCSIEKILEMKNTGLFSDADIKARCDAGK